MLRQQRFERRLGICMVLLVLLSGLIPQRLVLSAKGSTENPWQEFLIPADLLVQGHAEGISVIGRVLQLTPGAAVGIYTSPILHTPQPFTDTAPHWRSQAISEGRLMLEVRTSRDSLQWKDWIVTTDSGELEVNPDEEFFAPLIFVPQDEGVHQYLQFRITLQRWVPITTVQLEDLTFFLVDSRDGPTTTESLRIQQLLDIEQDMQSLNTTQVSKPAVISRTAWGCQDGQTSPRWTPRYADTHHIIVHHTVTPNNDTDWAQRVRSIWSYHANSKDWGDIGYNYLIDPNGNVYEGRAGGDNVTGAHSGSGYNTGTMAVSFIGCFHSSCNNSWGDKAPRPAALEASTALIAWKVSQRNLNPEGSANGYPIIAGHRDVASTACPGSELYLRLPELRTNVTARLNPERDNITLSYGQSDNNIIDPLRDKDTYYFNGTAGHNIRITMEKTSGNLDPYVEVYNPDGSLLGIDDDSGGNRNSKLERTLAQTGRYRIVARAWNNCCTGNYRLGLNLLGSSSDTDDNRWLAFGQSLQGTINPNNDRDIYYFSGTAGRVVSIRMNKIDSGLDPLVELWKPDGTFLSLNDDGGGNRNAWVAIELSDNGVYRIVARSWNHSSGGRYQVSLAAEQAANLAAGKRVVVSSTEVNWLPGAQAVDGSTNTRWSSQYRDPSWIYIDLGQNMTFSQVKLRWETAYGSQYGIYVQPNSQIGTSNWTNVYYTTQGNGGLDTITFSPVTARFVMMYGTQRGTQWGYSLWEFEVYNTAATPMPLVPPDPGDKDPEIVPLEEPPLPADADKDIDLTGEGDDAQENIPLPAADSPEALVDSSTVYTVPVAYILGPTLLELPQGSVLTLTGDGHDPDGGALAQYRWYADFAGQTNDDDDPESLPLVGFAATLELDMAALVPGEHTFYFQVQDDEGEWSVMMPIQARILARVFLPLVITR